MPGTGLGGELAHHREETVQQDQGKALSGEPPRHARVGSLITEVRDFLAGCAGRTKNRHVTAD